MTYSTRLAKPSEIADCADLYCRFFPGIGRPSVGATWWVAVTETGEVAGFASAKEMPDRTQPHGRAVFMGSAGVLPDHRGHGLHRRLIRARLRWAKRQGISRVFTYTMPDNAHSVANLVACGFLSFVPKVPWFEGCAHCHHDGVIYWEKLLA